MDINTQKHSFFNIEINGEEIRTTNQDSYYRRVKSTSGLTFDVSNQKALANIDVRGTVQTLTFYQNNHLTEEKPGVWVNKQLTQTTNLSLTVEVDGNDYDLSKTDHRVEVDLLHDSLPRYIHHYQTFKVIVIPFAPIIERKRLSMLVQQIYVVNETQNPLQVAAKEVPLYQKKYSDQQNVLIAQKGNEQKLAFSEAAKFSAALIDPNVFKEKKLFEESDTEIWLRDTFKYFDEIFGELTLPDKKWFIFITGHFIKASQVLAWIVIIKSWEVIGGAIRRRIAFGIRICTILLCLFSFSIKNYVRKQSCGLINSV